MKLIRHYSERHVRLSDLDFSLYQGHDDHRSFFKPRGLWLSIDDDGYGWADWCRAEQFGLHRLGHVHQVGLKNLDQLRIISTDDELRQFGQEFAIVDSRLTRLSPRFSYHELDWPRVQQAYKGVVITPYLHRMRLDHSVFWYYSWDCASGCVWSPDVIESIELLRVDPTPSEPEERFRLLQAPVRSSD